MHLTRFSDNALRCLILLGLEPERSVPVPEIATRMGISYEHLVKIVQRLATLGYVETVRGRNGGVRLTVEPVSLQLGTLIRRSRIPACIITHDRLDALTLADRTMLFDEGALVQSGPTREVFADPRTPAAAKLVGVDTVLPGAITSIDGGMAHVDVKLEVGHDWLDLIDLSAAEADNGERLYFGLELVASF